MRRVGQAFQPDGPRRKRRACASSLGSIATLVVLPRRWLGRLDVSLSFHTRKRVPWVGVRASGTESERRRDGGSESPSLGPCLPSTATTYLLVIYVTLCHLRGFPVIYVRLDCHLRGFDCHLRVIYAIFSQIVERNSFRFPTSAPSPRILPPAWLGPFSFDPTTHYPPQEGELMKNAVFFRAV
jgi:hypothetical protein